MLGGREAVPDTIGLAKVDLVGRLSAKSMMGHLGVVLPNVEIDQLLNAGSEEEGWDARVVPDWHPSGTKILFWEAKAEALSPPEGVLTRIRIANLSSRTPIPEADRIQWVETPDAPWAGTVEDADPANVPAWDIVGTIRGEVFGRAELTHVPGTEMQNGGLGRGTQGRPGLAQDLEKLDELAPKRGGGNRTLLSVIRQPDTDTRFSGVSLSKARNPTSYARTLQYPGIPLIALGSGHYLVIDQWLRHSRQSAS